MKEVDLSNPDVVRYVVKRFGLRMNKKLGQNFLIRHAVVDDIADAAGIGEGDPVLEIGPGIGTLTQALAETGAAVTAVELDDHLLPSSTRRWNTMITCALFTAISCVSISKKS